MIVDEAEGRILTEIYFTEITVSNTISQCIKLCTLERLMIAVLFCTCKHHFFNNLSPVRNLIFSLHQNVAPKYNFSVNIIFSLVPPNVNTCVKRERGNYKCTSQANGKSITLLRKILLYWQCSTCIFSENKVYSQIANKLLHVILI